MVEPVFRRVAKLHKLTGFQQQIGVKNRDFREKDVENCKNGAESRNILACPAPIFPDILSGEAEL
jgi:hypothetical protein